MPVLAGKNGAGKIWDGARINAFCKNELASRISQNLHRVLGILCGFMSQWFRKQAQEPFHKKRLFYFAFFNIYDAILPIVGGIS